MSADGGAPHAGAIAPAVAAPSRRHVRISATRRSIGLDARELLEYRDLLLILVMRDVKIRYKQTALGVVWVVLQPLLAALIFTVIFGYFARLPSSGVPYALFAYSALIPWTLFAGILQRAGSSLVSDSRLISKIYFPRIIIPMSSALAVLVDFAVSLLVMFVLLALYRMPITWHIVLLPVGLFLTLLSSIGLSLCISALNVYYRDFTYVLPFMIQILMYASPLVYSGELIPPDWRPLYSLNPMVGSIGMFRWALLGIRDFPLYAIATSAVIGIGLVVAGATLFRRVERNFADVI